MDEAVLGHQVDNLVLLRDLHRDREVVGGFLREIDVDGSLGEDGITLLVVDFNNVELGACRSAVAEGEDLGLCRRALQFDGTESSGVALDCLTDTAVARVELHISDNATLLRRDGDDNHPLLVMADSVVDDLGAQVGVAVEHFDGRGLAWIKDVPVVDTSLCNQTQALVAVPLPENDVLVHGGRLQLGLCAQVEDLKSTLLGAESDDVLGPVHDGVVSLDRATNDTVVVLEVDNNNLGRGSVANADIVI